MESPSSPTTDKVEAAVPGFGVLVLAGGVLAQLVRFTVPWSYRDVLELAATEAGEDANLLHAIAWHESRMNPAAVSPANHNNTRDYGLMQINQANFGRLGLTAESALDPAASARAAAQLLRDGARPGLSLADRVSIYNAGARPDGGPHRTAAGAYINSEYVMDVLDKYRWVQLARLAPLQRV